MIVFVTSHSVCPKYQYLRDVLSIFGWEVEVVESWEDHLTAWDGAQVLHVEGFNHIRHF